MAVGNEVPPEVRCTLGEKELWTARRQANGGAATGSHRVSQSLAVPAATSRLGAGYGTAVSALSCPRCSAEACVRRGGGGWGWAPRLVGLRGRLPGGSESLGGDQPVAPGFGKLELQRRCSNTGARRLLSHCFLIAECFCKNGAFSL